MFGLGSLRAENAIGGHSRGTARCRGNPTGAESNPSGDDQRLGAIAGARSAHADPLGAPNGDDRQPRLMRDEARDPLFIVPHPPGGA